MRIKVHYGIRNLNNVAIYQAFRDNADTVIGS